jgi:electron transfer flavoprotein beta subunit
VALPAIVTVHDAAPPALAFVYRAQRGGVVYERPGTPLPLNDAVEYAYRQRPKLIGEAAPASAAGRLMVAPSPEDAAAAVLAYVEKFRTIGAA